jgi:GT2 family glycosyltransferase
MPGVKYKVCVVTVTYGDRQRFLDQVIARVLSFAQVANLIVVNNASIHPMVNTDERVTVLNNAENEGSAGGYHKGIKYAFENTDCDFIWLLDDDNMPEEGCLDKLLEQWDTIPAADNKKALFCLRDDRKTHVKIARGDDPMRYYLVPDNFLGFNVFRIAYNQYRKFADKLNKSTAYKEQVTMPYVPYGGLLMHRQLVAEIGYPNEALYLYVDDSEYSYRITQNGGTIWLVPTCRVVDIDKSQGINYKKRQFHSQLLDEWSFRTYYHIRNRIYFYSRVAIRNKFMFAVNKALYLTFLRLIGMLSSKTAEYKKLVQAVKDGLSGNLGKANPDKF